MNSTEMIAVIDGHLAELGTQSLFDGDKIRDILMDLRLMCMLDNDPPPVPLVADPALFTEIITGI